MSEYINESVEYCMFHVPVFSGPKRYDYVDGGWMYKHDGVRLHDLLSAELSATFGRVLDFSTCECSGHNDSTGSDS